METVTTVVIDIFYHTKTGEKFTPLEYIEHQVTVDGVMVYQCKSTPKKWFRSKEPLRMFELWLLDEERRYRGYIANNVEHSFKRFRNRWVRLRNFFYLRSQSFYLKTTQI